ncbi:hypothetical protein ACFQ3Z_16015 [Streptomyces nogalater]
MAATPYVTAEEFRAHPTYLDLDTLRSGIMDPDAQTAELTNVLLMASAWADTVCNQPLGAHRVDLSTQGRIDYDGHLVLFPSDRPVLSVAAVSYGSTLSRMTYQAAPARPGRHEPDDLHTRRPYRGPRPGLGRHHVHRRLGVHGPHRHRGPGDTFLTVGDATGILPGARYRLWSPGAEETVTVSPAWTPPAVTAALTAVTVPLAAPIVHAHTSGAGLSGMPADMRLAVINYTIAQLMRPDTAAEDSYPDTSLSPGTRQQDSRKDGSGLVAEAERILNSYARRM